MKQLNIMIKPASSMCNMQCRYCFYSDVSHIRDVSSFGFMSLDVATALIQNVFKDVDNGDYINFSFQGGEPTIVGLPFYEAFVDNVKLYASKAKVSYALQTNGILLDEAWCVFLKKHNFLVGLSLDCDRALHNQNRIDSKGTGSFKNVMDSKRLFDKYKVEYNVMCVLTNEIARHPCKVWKFILDENIKYIQFIPCLDGLEQIERNVWALTPKRFYDFYSTLAMFWMEELQKGKYISVKMFDDIVNLFMHGQVTACGLHGYCHPQFVIESDGGIYPCDFYAIDKYLVGNITCMSFNQAFEKASESGFLTSRETLPKECHECRYLKECHGGCKRMESNMYVDNNGLCGYREFLDKNLHRLCEYGRALSFNK